MDTQDKLVAALLVVCTIVFAALGATGNVAPFPAEQPRNSFVRTESIGFYVPAWVIDDHPPIVVRGWKYSRPRYTFVAIELPENAVRAIERGDQVRVDVVVSSVENSYWSTHFLRPDIGKNVMVMPVENNGPDVGERDARTIGIRVAVDLTSAGDVLVPRMRMMHLRRVREPEAR